MRVSAGRDGRWKQEASHAAPKMALRRARRAQDATKGERKGVVAGEGRSGLKLSPVRPELIEVSLVRTAVANYIRSEGCGCCSDRDAHREDEEALAKLLDVEPYLDGSGYDFGKYNEK